jgi:hypothetical protein
MNTTQQTLNVCISFRKKIHDVGLVLRSLWFILLFLALGLVAFVFVEQGQDMLFAIYRRFKMEFFSFLVVSACHVGCTNRIWL